MIPGGRVLVAVSALAFLLPAVAGCFKRAQASTNVPEQESTEARPALPSPPPRSRSSNPPPGEPAPRLIGDAETPTPGSVGERIAHGERIVAVLTERGVEPTVRDQLADAQAFLKEAREALAAGDLPRSAILADKAIILLEHIQDGSPKPASPDT